MPTEDIDDLFRDRLTGHVTPPAEGLWARLPAGTGKAAPAEPIQAVHLTPDHLFQRRLGSHATPPGRELWERLEDEHLRPRRHRAAAWWPRALAAAVALLLVAGSIGLWWGLPRRKVSDGRVVRQVRRADHPTQSGPAAGLAGSTAPARQLDQVRQTVAAGAPAVTPAQTKLITRTTRSRTFASTAPKDHRAILESAPRRAPGSNRPPAAAAGRLAHGTDGTPPVPNRTTAADERLQSSGAGPTVAATLPPLPPPTTTATAAGLARRGDLITVDVRNGADPGARPVLADDARRAGTTAAAPAESQRLGGRLLHQAGHLLRGERLNLAEVTGLAETLTLRATVAGRRLTKTIQL